MQLTRMDYKDSRKFSQKSRQKGKIRLIILLTATALISLYSFLAITKPITVQPTTLSIAKNNHVEPSLLWPAIGQAAIGSLEDGILESTNNQIPMPIASTAKVITALAVLEKKPITSGQGETITLTQKDVDLYNYYLSINGSNAAVSVGEQISEYQALEALMLPSANNMADSLAIWAFGSIDAYIAYATKLVHSFGAVNTTVSDTSGLSASTVSTAHDLIILGQEALQNPILKQIVSEKEATIPVAGLIRNVNQLLGTNNIIGIKTGNTEEAGGCLLFAATHNIDSSHAVTIIGSVVGTSDLSSAFESSLALLDSAKANFKAITILPANTKVGFYATAWGSQTDIYTKEDLKIYGWEGKEYLITTQLNSVNTPLIAQAATGTINVTGSGKTATTAVNVKAALQKPSIIWRLKHYF